MLALELESSVLINCIFVGIVARVNHLGLALGARYKILSWVFLLLY